jgi:hypothetical protein
MMDDPIFLPRKYQTIWIQLKKPYYNRIIPANIREAGISVSAHRAFHKRIIKAVMKEKWLDVGFKIWMEPRRAELRYTRSASIITFYLHLYPAITALELELMEPLEIHSPISSIQSQELSV